VAWLFLLLPAYPLRTLDGSRDLRAVRLQSEDPGQEEEWKDDPLHPLHEAIWPANAAVLGEDGESPAGGS
jgi:hypothetical protein